MEDLGYLKFSLAREALEKGDEVSAIALLQESLALNEHSSPTIYFNPEN